MRKTTCVLFCRHAHISWLQHVWEAPANHTCTIMERVRWSHQSTCQSKSKGPSWDSNIFFKVMSQTSGMRMWPSYLWFNSLYKTWKSELRVTRFLAPNIWKRKNNTFCLENPRKPFQFSEPENIVPQHVSLRKAEGKRMSGVPSGTSSQIRWRCMFHQSCKLWGYTLLCSPLQSTG